MSNFKLRPWRESDGADFFHFACCTAVTKYMRKNFPATREDCETMVRAFSDDKETGQCCRAVEIEGHAVGSIGLFLDGRGGGELAYWLGEPFWRQGIMTEAIRALCAKTLERYAIDVIFAMPFEGNLASRRTLEKAGFSLVRQGTRECFYVMKRGI